MSPGPAEKIIMKPAKSTFFQSYMNTFKLVFGLTFLSLPKTFSRTGWLGGIVLLSMVGALNVLTMYINLIVAERHNKIPSYS